MPTEIIKPGTHIDFIGKRQICAVLSLSILAAGIAAIPIRGIKLGIDFAGGTEAQFRFESGVDVDESAIRAVVSGCGIEDASVIRYGETDESEFLVRFAGEAGDEGAGGEAPASCPLSDADRERLAQAAEAGGGEGQVGEKGELVDRLQLALANAVGPLELRRVEFVGPRVGAELRRDGLRALGLATVLILLYIAFRFSTRFAPGAIVALVHDVGITAGFFVILGLEFDLRVLAALLAILGYSLNDTIIIYDRIRENMELRTKSDLIEVLNLSVNQTLARTVLTSGTTMAVVLTLLFLGGEVIRPFAIAMSIGILVGTYSSVFIASPTLLWLEMRSAGTSQPGEAKPEPRREARAATGNHPRQKARGKKRARR